MRVSVHCLAVFLAAVLAFAGVAIAQDSSYSAREIQQAFVNRGYDPGVVDGVWGRRSTNALKAFQKAEGLPQSGALDKPTAEKLFPQRVIVHPVGQGLEVDREVPVGGGSCWRSQALATRRRRSQRRSVKSISPASSLAALSVLETSRVSRSAAMRILPARSRISPSSISRPRRIMRWALESTMESGVLN